jgi:immunity protein 10 of polymorphic toxin system
MSAVGTTGLRVFEAKEVGIDRGEYAVAVGLARDSSNDGSEDAFLLQRSSVPDIDKPGIAGVYVEVPIQRCAIYGGIAEAALRRDSLEIRLSEEASKQFGEMAGFRGEFNIDEAAFDELREALRFVFRDCACYKELI